MKQPNNPFGVATPEGVLRSLSYHLKEGNTSIGGEMWRHGLSVADLAGDILLEAVIRESNPEDELLQRNIDRWISLYNYDRFDVIGENPEWLSIWRKLQLSWGD